MYLELTVVAHAFLGQARSYVMTSGGREPLWLLAVGCALVLDELVLASPHVLVDYFVREGRRDVRL
jgi:hypothetical protein